ncbi:MAG: AgmX/PglI C-terminal domain-containing protein [Pseudobdellovibrio sp.]
MKKSNWIVPGLIVLGIALILISTWAPQKKFDLGFSKKIAGVIEKTGSVKFQNSGMPADTEVKLNYQIDIRDILKTDEDSEALIEFSNGGQFRLAEKSEVLIDKLDTGSPLVVVRTGDIFVEKFGKAPSFWVRKEGQIYTAVDYALVDKKNASRLKEAMPQSQTREQLSQIEIEGILNSKKNDFFKCFGQLIQKNPQATGSVLISFTIEKQGHTSKVEISKSEILDAGFKSCLMEVVARTHFRAFSGSPVATVFPLKFE